MKKNSKYVIWVLLFTLTSFIVMKLLRSSPEEKKKNKNNNKLNSQINDGAKNIALDNKNLIISMQQQIDILKGALERLAQSDGMNRVPGDSIEINSIKNRLDLLENKLRAEVAKLNVEIVNNKDGIGNFIPLTDEVERLINEVKYLKTRSHRHDEVHTMPMNTPGNYVKSPIVGTGIIRTTPTIRSYDSTRGILDQFAALAAASAGPGRGL